MAKTQRETESLRWRIEPPDGLHRGFYVLGCSGIDFVAPSKEPFYLTPIPSAQECVLWSVDGDQVRVDLVVLED